MAGFYRCFIREFATFTEPLNRLTSAKVPFAWSEDCETALEALKQALISEPGKLFVVEVDASNVAIGGVLSQYQKANLLHPVAYFSTALTSAQEKWSVYLVGTKFVVKSDHNPLIHIQKKKDPPGKLARWIAELGAFDFDIQHVTGQHNGRADALSRNQGASDNHVPDEQLLKHVLSK